MGEVELSKVLEAGELSRDFGLDITVSRGGLVTSALNQRQYRAECGKLYQQFMLSMADYIYEETQLKKRLQGLHLQKKQPWKAPPVNSTCDALPEGLDLNGDEDSFTPAQMEEFRRLASSRASNRSVSRTGIINEADIARPPTSASVKAPSRVEISQTEVPRGFPALKEPSPTIGSTTKTSRARSAVTQSNKRCSLVSEAILYGGRDQAYDGVMDPSSDYSANRRMRMNPRAFSRLSSAGSIKVKVMDKQGEFVMKPVSGQPGIVSVSSSQDKEEGEQHQVPDSKDKMALVKTATSFKTPTLSSELKTNNLLAIQKSLLGKQAKRMTVGEVMAKSRDRRARLFRVQVSTGRMDSWEMTEEKREQTSNHTKSAGHHSQEVIDISAQLGTDSEANKVKPQPLNPRAKTAPPSRSKLRSSSIPTPRPDPATEYSLRTPGGGHANRSPSPNLGGRRLGRFSPSQPQLSVVQLELDDPAKDHNYPQSSSQPAQQPQRKNSSSAVRRQSSSSSRAVFPLSSKALANENKCTSRSVRFGTEKQRTREAKAVPEQEFSVHVKHIHTLRDSAAVVRRWKELDRDREDKLNKWRMRMSFAATRRGNLGKVLSRV